LDGELQGRAPFSGIYAGHHGPTKGGIQESRENTTMDDAAPVEKFRPDLCFQDHARGGVPDPVETQEIPEWKTTLVGGSQASAP